MFEKFTDVPEAEISSIVSRPQPAVCICVRSIEHLCSCLRLLACIHCVSAPGLCLWLNLSEFEIVLLILWFHRLDETITFLFCALSCKILTTFQLLGSAKNQQPEDVSVLGSVDTFWHQFNSGWDASKPLQHWSTLRPNAGCCFSKNISSQHRAARVRHCQQPAFVLMDPELKHLRVLLLLRSQKPPSGFHSCCGAGDGFPPGTAGECN